MELNVLVLGMPNVGKSTLLNMLRHAGIKGRKLYFFQVFHIFSPSYPIAFLQRRPKLSGHQQILG
jgi:hypothetical protein